MSDKIETPKDMDPGTEAASLPELRFLKAMVPTLAGVMIVGLLAILALLVIRFSSPQIPAPVLPASVALPEGEVARAVTFGPGWYAVVTETDLILIFDAQTGALRQKVAITR